MASHGSWRARIHFVVERSRNRTLQRKRNLISVRLSCRGIAAAFELADGLYAA